MVRAARADKKPEYIFIAPIVRAGYPDPHFVKSNQVNPVIWMCTEHFRTKPRFHREVPVCFARGMTWISTSAIRSIRCWLGAEAARHSVISPRTDTWNTNWLNYAWNWIGLHSCRGREPPSLYPGHSSRSEWSVPAERKGLPAPYVQPGL